MPPARSFSAIVRHVPPSCDGLTHASTVIADAGDSDADAGTVTMSSAPSNESAPPVWPATRAGPPVAVPSLPRPDESVTVSPLASSKAYEATSPGAGELCWGGAAAPLDTGRCMSAWISWADSAWS